MKKKYLFLVVFIVSITLYLSGINPNYYASLKNRRIGCKVDSLDGVYVFYNGKIGHIGKRNTTKDGYNLGLKYQCVEFVKRYYYYHYKHKMPHSFGNAKDYFDKGVKDGKLNKQRGLIQFTNPSTAKPKKGDLLIFSGIRANPYGHVAIVSKVHLNKIEIIQQNPGPMAPSRQYYALKKIGKKFKIENKRILGWLRKK